MKTYSSGMRAMLAFALSLAIEFDCYVIDEVILVGDRRLKKKCIEELFDRRADRAMLIASHDMHTIQTFCVRAVVVHQGRATDFDNVAEAVAMYNSL